MTVPVNKGTLLSEVVRMFYVSLYIYIYALIYIYLYGE